MNSTNCTTAQMEETPCNAENAIQGRASEARIKPLRRSSLGRAEKHANRTNSQKSAGDRLRGGACGSRMPCEAKRSGKSQGCKHNETPEPRQTHGDLR